MAVQVTGREQLTALADRLRAAGDEGNGLKRNLYKKLNEAAVPLAKEIGSVEHLIPYMPNRYAEVLAADLGVRISKTFFAANPRIEVVAKARQHRRRLPYLDTGFINHPDWARGPRSGWRWSNGQTGGIRPGFFSNVLKEQAPAIREKVAQAMTETANQITRG